MPLRKIIQIDEEKCTGCGACVVDCAEGALAIIDGKAKVVNEIFCDGLGACIGACPEDALTLIEREAPAFDESAVETHLKQQSGESSGETMACGCPSSMERMFDAPQPIAAASGQAAPVSQLTQWPVQLRLLPTVGPLYDNKSLLLLADCVAPAFPALHQDLIKGHTVVMTCPKLDNVQESIAKLAEILMNPIAGIQVAIMEVPCCNGLLHIIRKAQTLANTDFPVEAVKIGIRGEILERFKVENETAETTKGKAIRLV